MRAPLHRPLLLRRLFGWSFLALIAACGQVSDIMPDADPADREPPVAEAAPAPFPVVPADPLTLSALFPINTKMPDAGTFKPRSRTPAWAYDFPIDWEADPFDDRNWRFQLHALRIVDPYLARWEAAGDHDALSLAAKIALDWAAAYPDVPERIRKVNGSEGETMAWQDMGTGLRAMRLAYLWDRIADGDLALGEEDVAALRQALVNHAEVLADPDSFKINNHGLFVAHGLMASCRAVPDAEGCDTKRGLARDRLIRVLTAQYLADGGHAEHSPAYHDFVLGTLEKMAASGWYRLSADQEAILEKADDVSGWMADATGMYPAIGDSERKRNPDAEDVFAPQAGCDRTDEPGDACFGFKWLDRTGYAVLRTAPNVPEAEQASLFVTCGRHGSTHKHEDDLSFELIEGGRHVIVDGGKWGYDRDAMRGYVLSRAAHSTISFADGRASGEREGACLTDAAWADGAMTVSGAFPLARGVTHRRDLAWRPGEELLVADTITQEGRGDAYEVRWHLAPGIVAEKADDGFALFAADGDAVARVAAPAACDWDAVMGTDIEKPTAGWYSPSYREAVPIVSLVGRCPAKERRVVTRFVFAE